MAHFGITSPKVRLSRNVRKLPNALSTQHCDQNPRPECAGSRYKEGVFVGYRGYRHGTQPLFPFGYGLSYSTFKFSNLKVTPSSFTADEPVTVSFDVTNTGGIEGQEVAQLYVHDTHSKVERPEKELKGFLKISLKPGETKDASIRLDRRAFSYYDVNSKQWIAEPGDFGILVSSSAEQVELQGLVKLTR
jgi:beta-glucosidase